MDKDIQTKLLEMQRCVYQIMFASDVMHTIIEQRMAQIHQAQMEPLETVRNKDLSRLDELIKSCLGNSA